MRSFEKISSLDESFGVYFPSYLSFPLSVLSANAFSVSFCIHHFRVYPILIICLTLWALSLLCLLVSLFICPRGNITSCNCLTLRITCLTTFHTDFSITEGLLLWSLSPRYIYSCAFQFGVFRAAPFLFLSIVSSSYLTQRLIVQVDTPWLFFLLLRIFLFL